MSELLREIDDHGGFVFESKDRDKKEVSTEYRILNRIGIESNRDNIPFNIIYTPWSLHGHITSYHTGSSPLSLACVVIEEIK